MKCASEAGTRDVYAHRPLFCGSAIFAIVIALQTWATVSRASLYPLNAYRMFDSHWPDGVVMDRVILRSDGKEYPTWETLRIPFFQANNAAFVTFLDPMPAVHRNRLCGEIAKRITGTSAIEVIGQELRFAKDGEGQMKSSIVSSEVKYTCTR
jgi:hypothetical protein